MTESEAPPTALIDRTKWGQETRRDEGGEEYTAVLCDGHEVGQIYPDERSGGFVWMLDHTPSANPFSENPCPTEPTLEMAVEKVQLACRIYWECCGTCGGDTTDE